MTEPRRKDAGFGIVEVIAVVVVLVVLVALAYVLVGRKDENKQAPVSNTAQSSEMSSVKALKLASDNVQFEIPKDWTVGKSNCIDAPGANIACSDGATLIPSKTATTIYGGGTEYFTVYVGVYDNAQNAPAKTWFEETYQGGSSTAADKTSSDKINGYDTYYFRQITKSYDEIRYVYAAKGKAVLVTARVSEEDYDANGKVNASSDFTKYVSDIEALAKTIKIN